MKRKSFILLLLTFVLLILLCGCAESSVEEGTLEATLDPDRKNITVKVSPDADLLKEYESSDVYLFALETGKSEYSLKNEAPIATVKGGASVSFSIPLVENGCSRLYYSFTAALFDADRNEFVEAVDSSAYISNPEILSENGNAFPKQTSIKGLCADYDTEAVMLGASHIIIDLPVEKYLLPSGRADAESYVYNSNSYYLDENELHSLDERVRYYFDNKVNVYFRITLASSQEELDGELKCLAYSGTKKGSAEYAFDLSNPQCAEYVAGFLDFLAERYTRADAKYGLACAFIAGYGMNTPGKGVASVSADDYVNSCATLLRIMHIAITSHYENGRVYLTVDDKWKAAGGSACDQSGYNFIVAVSKRTALQGDYGWGVAASVKAYSNPDRVWYDNSGDGKYLTPDSIGRLSDELMSRSEMLYGEERRSVIVSGIAIELTDSELNQAVSYAYAYYKAAAAGVDAFCYSCQADIKVGLHSADSSGRPVSSRKILETFRDIDTNADVSFYTSAALSENKIKELYENYKDIVQVKQKGTGASAPANAEDYDTSVMFDFKDGTLGSFFTFGRKSYSGLVRRGDAASLEASLIREDTASYPYISRRGINPSDFNGDSILLRFDLASSVIFPSEKYSLTLTLVQSGNGVIYESVATVKAGKDQTLAFDISEFNGIKGGEEVELRLAAEGEGGSSCILTIHSILTGKTRTNTTLIVLLIVLASAAIVTVMVLLVIWFRRNYRADSHKNKRKKK